MSKSGRRIIDGIKSGLGGYIRLPAPPYGTPSYWTSVYRNFQPDAVFEWGNLALEQDLMQYEYKSRQQQKGSGTANDSTSSTSLFTSFAETIGVAPNDTETSILILGCGYSRLGEDMHAHGWKNITQVDIASKAISDLSERCKSMECIEDDARALSAFTTDTNMTAVVDKGLIDSLFLADEQHIHDIMSSVHRILQPNGTFLIFSLSEPTFLLPQLLMKNEVIPSWQPNVDVRELESTFLYRCHKLPEPKSAPVMKKKNKKRGR
jgi:SAM-dependent methyltransferase